MLNEDVYRNIPEDQRESFGAIGSSLGLASDRRKTWDQCTEEERIERLREQLRTKEMAIQELRLMLGQLMTHSHGSGGELLTPIRYGVGPCGRLRDPLE